MSGGWHRAIAFALIGEELDLPEHDTPDVTALAAELAESGWSVERVVARADAERSHGIWPFGVPDGLRSGLGAAQLHAAIQAARARYGLDGLSVQPPSRRTSLTADERRLLNDVPPHY